MTDTQSTQPEINPYYQFPVTGLVRLWQIIGDEEKGIPPYIPISRTSWNSGVKSGKYPKPIKLSKRTSLWRAEDVRALVEGAK